MATVSSTGSSVFALVSLFLICIVVLLVLRHYLPLRVTPAFLLVPVFLALALPTSIVLLVPIDLASHAKEEDGPSRGIYLPDGVLQVSWRITYWLTFVLTWFILPVLGDYVDAGYREPKARAIYALRSNLRYQLILLTCGIVGLVYLVINTRMARESLTGQGLKSLVMALAYAWGLILAIYLMGHGLVAVPRRLFKSASVSGRLKTLQMNAPRLHERMTDAITDLEDLEAQVVLLRQRKTGSAREFHEWIEELADASDLPESRILHGTAGQGAAASLPAVITERYMADLTRKVKRARHKRLRFIEEWDYLVREAADLQSILDATSSKKLEFNSRGHGTSWLAQHSFLTPTMRFYLYAKFLPVVRLMLSGILALASACIVWSEIFKAVAPRLSVVGLSIVHHPNSDTGKIGFAGQVMATCWLTYMCVAALTSIREVKVWGNRALVRRHTYGESACWYACQVAKLTVPLSYNFITFTPHAIYTQSTFHRFLGQLIDFTPLGSGFSAFFPIFIVIPVLASAFNLYSRVQKILGFGAMLADDDDDNDSDNANFSGVREGRALIARELAGNTVGGLTSASTIPYTDAASSSAAAAASAVHAGAIQDDNPWTLAASPPQHAPYSDSPAPRGVHVPAPRRHAVDDDDGADDQPFFQAFAHRLQNTIDTAEPPAFFKDVGKRVAKRPKWLGGEGSGDGSGSGNRIGRLFAGSGAGGGVRL